MKFPAIAKRNYETLHQDPQFAHIVQGVFEELLKISDPVRRAETIHELIDHFNRSVFENEVVKSLSPCKQGCAHCCHNEVSVTQDEVELILSKSLPPIDLELLAKQQQDFKTLSYEDRRCVFLDSQNSCSIYPDRPSVCRTNAVLGDSQQCIDSSNLRLVNTFQADMAIYSHFLFSGDGGTLPELLSKKLAVAEKE